MPPVARRGYCSIQLRTIDSEARTIRGTASTPQPDRMGDVVEPLGISFKNPVPLLLYHDTKRPVGTVRFFAPTKDGLDFEAQIADIAEPGTLKDRVEEAWQSLKAGLLQAVSIGFRSIEEAFVKETATFHFLKTEVLELSLVTIPANPGATIAEIKSFMAAMGRTTDDSPGDAGMLPIVRVRKDARPMKITEQISAFEATRAAKAARQNELMTASADKGETLDAAQAEEYDGLTAEIKSVDAHLTRLRAQEQSNVAAAAVITPTLDAAAAAAQRGGRVISVKANVPPGTAFVRYCRALVASRGSRLEAIEFAKQWRDSTPEVELALKAAVAAGNTTDATWAAPLAQPTPLAAEFLELLRPATVIGKIPNLRHVPFNVSVTAQTGGGTYGWVGQGAPKPVGKLAFSSAVLGIAKCAGIIVISEELARVSSPSAEDVIRQDMKNGIAAFLDVEFTDPAKAPVANVSPGSITNGLAIVPSTGTTPGAARVDINALAAAMLAQGISTAGAVLLMSETNALALGGSLNALGQPVYPGLGPLGGAALGYPVIASQALGNNVVLVQGSGILIADEGGIEIDVSREASVQMDSAPMNPADATVVMTSLWQNNLVGLRADRIINWKRARNGAVQYTQAVYVVSATPTAAEVAALGGGQQQTPRGGSKPADHRE